MLIGIQKETKQEEHRVAIVPKYAKKLIDNGHIVHVEHNAGIGSKFTDEDYEKIGAKIVSDVSDCNMVVKVKEPKINSLRKNQIIMAYLHIDKGQNKPLLSSLLKNNITSYAYEEIRDDNGNRLINLGKEAGIVGMYEGLRIYGQILAKHGFVNRFKHLKPIKEYFCVAELYDALQKANIDNGVKVYIFGKGRVSSGVQEVLKYSTIRPNILYRDKTLFIDQYLENADIIVNAVDWYPGEPHIITKNMLKLMKNTSIIIDISCDKEGAIESCRPTSWEKPTYIKDGVTHYCVDNLPSAIPRDASVHLSEMIFDSVLKVANEEELPTGLMTKDGNFEFAKHHDAAKKHIESHHHISEDELSNYS